jgi:deoxyribodipyrimidine photo-lyase
VDTASSHEEYSAATLRRKLLPLTIRYLVTIEEQPVHIDAAGLGLHGLSLGNIDTVLAAIDTDRSVPATSAYHGGTSEAIRRLNEFIEKKLDNYAERSNDPNADARSGLSPFLHFGQISPIMIALAVRETGSPGMESFLEELIVRRELGINFVHFNPLYDSFDCLPEWAKKTLLAHAGDRREYLYSPDDLEKPAHMIPTGMPRNWRWYKPARCMVICVCTGERNPGMDRGPERCLPVHVSPE